MQAFFIKLILGIIKEIKTSLGSTHVQGAKAGKLESRLRAKLKKEGWG